MDKQGLKAIIRDVPDFPKEGIIFKDITTLLMDPDALGTSIDLLVSECKKYNIDKVVGIESRGFIFGTPVSTSLARGFVPIRKPGKLPAETISETYELEYGTDSIEIHKDAIQEGDNIVLIDDLLATGGTAGAACNLIEKLGGKVVLVAFIIELTFLNGRSKLPGQNVFSLLEF